MCSVTSWRNWLNWFWSFHQRVTVLPKEFVVPDLMVLKRIFSPLGRRYFTPHLKATHKGCNSPHCHTFITLLGVWRGWSIAPCDLVDALVARQHSQNSMAAIHYLTALIKVSLPSSIGRCAALLGSLHKSPHWLLLLLTGFYVASTELQHLQQEAMPWRLLAVMFSAHLTSILPFRNVKMCICSFQLHESVER